MALAYSSEEFEEKFTYAGRDLGAVWAEDATHFRLWAPTAREAGVVLYRTGGPEGAPMGIFQMDRGENGTWTVRLPGNLNGVYYTFRVLLDGNWVEACDPYAKAAGVNGRRAMVIDMPSTDPAGWMEDRDPNFGKPITEAVIYELHLRDLSMHRSSGMKHKGKFLALTEGGLTTDAGRPVGLDHIKNLGVTHIHLLPVFDFGFTDEEERRPQYNWGYDPVNFNVPEGSYASDPYDGAVRVREMKQMVKALHDNGLSVIMDVVYNHVFDGQGFCFNRLVPGYFSRINENGVYSNGSACGNDTATERSMVRKYIVDSLCHWADCYHIDGFRFDLVGLMDVETIRACMEAVHRTHPNVIFYGEGWSMNTRLTKPGQDLAVQSNSHKLPGFAFFSDTTRDLLRGSMFSASDLGFAAGGCRPRELLDACFMGMPQWAASPSQCVNYASCHDNNTLMDRLSLSAPEAPREVLIRMNNLAAAFVMLSQGVPFFQAGEELLRTKPGRRGSFDGNSYRSPDKVNSIKWNTLDKTEYAETSDYYRGLIAFRKAHSCLRLQTRDQVYHAVRPVGFENPHTAVYHITGTTHEIFAIFNSDAAEVTVPLPTGEWDVNIDDRRAGTVCLAKARDRAMAAPLSALVLTRKKDVEVVAALLWEKDKLLICQRPAGKTRGLLWEFAGGKVEPGETLPQALVRECREELGVTIQVGSQFNQVVHEYPDMRIRLTLFHCQIPLGIPPLALEHKDLRWVHPSKLSEYSFCPADKTIAEELIRVYGDKEPL